MKISIIIPVFNAEKYLKECLESIVNQTYRDIEIVLINDGSTDDSEAICKKYSALDSRIKYIEKVNSGVMDTRVVGFNNCTGEYIYSVDSDDVVDLNCVQKIIDIIAATSADIVCFNGYKFFEDTKNKTDMCNGIVGVFDSEQIKSNILKNCIGGIPGVKTIDNSLCLKFIRRELIEFSLKYCNQKIAFGEDMLISFISIANANKIVFIDDKFYYYRQFQEQSTKKYKTNLIEVEENLISNLLKANSDYGLDCKNEILRHALVTAKSTIFNEVKFGKKYKIVKSKTIEIYNSHYYTEMICSLNVTNFSKQEKVLFFLLKHKHTAILFVLAKIIKVLKGI